jgi:ferritin-like metal-binding protein YciE
LKIYRGWVINHKVEKPGVLTNMDKKDILMGWLNDAYGMEKSIIQVLENHVNDADDFPEIQQKIQEHLDITRSQAERIKTRIEDLGGSVSAIKTTIADALGAIRGVSTGLAKDEIVKNAIMEYSTEYMEIASYEALIAAAGEIDDQETVNVCQEILTEEEEMADWLEEQLPTLVSMYMQKQG